MQNPYYYSVALQRILHYNVCKIRHGAHRCVVRRVCGLADRARHAHHGLHGLHTTRRVPHGSQAHPASEAVPGSAHLSLRAGVGYLSAVQAMCAPMLVLPQKLDWTTGMPLGEPFVFIGISAILASSPANPAHLTQALL